MSWYLSYVWVRVKGYATVCSRSAMNHATSSVLLVRRMRG
jgi:hypothetical protein